jgi:hypothetical protein
MRPVSLSKYQLQVITTSVAAFPPEQREDVIKRIASHLGEHPSDPAVFAAISLEIGLRGAGPEKVNRHHA